MWTGDQPILRVRELSEPSESEGMSAASAQARELSESSRSDGMSAASAQPSSSTSEGTVGAGAAQLSLGDVGVIVVVMVGVGRVMALVDDVGQTSVSSVSSVESSVESLGLASAVGTGRVLVSSALVVRVLVLVYTPQRRRRF